MGGESVFKLSHLTPHNSRLVTLRASCQAESVSPQWTMLRMRCIYHLSLWWSNTTTTASDRETPFLLVAGLADDGMDIAQLHAFLCWSDVQPWLCTDSEATRCESCGFFLLLLWLSSSSWGGQKRWGCDCDAWGNLDRSVDQSMVESMAPSSPGQTGVVLLHERGEGEHSGTSSSWSGGSFRQKPTSTFILPRNQALLRFVLLSLALLASPDSVPRRLRHLY